jgi:methionine-gamma-lyase
MKTPRKVPSDARGQSTRAIHGTEKKHGVSAGVGPSIYRTANFTFSSTAEMKRWAEGKSSAYIYTRYGNPTLAAVQEKLAQLEGGEAALVTASGMAAISSTLFSLLQAGDEIVATTQLYGGSYRLMRDILPRCGIKVHHVDSSLAGAEELITPRTRAFYIESPTNPTLRLVDIRKAAAIARRHGLVSIIDGTFASPILQRPLDLGIDIVVHSATKYLAGHSDVIAGAVVGSAKRVAAIHEMVVCLGGSMDPEAAFLLDRGIKTLGIRVQRQCENAMAVAKFLARHPKVARVHYPGLPSHPDHRLARQQMSGYGAMLAFDMKGGVAAARRVCDRVRLFLLAASLGGVESLVVLPIYTSHYNMSAKELTTAGVTPGTIRVSVGLEDPADLLADLKQALA